MTGRDLRLAGRLGWRNLWRNSRRTLITALGIGAAFLILIVLIGLLGGVREQLLRNGTELMLGHVQIHRAEYLPDRHVADTIPTTELPRVLEQIAAHPDVRALAPRVRVDGLIASADASAGGQLLGVDPGREARVTTLLEAVGAERLGEPGGHGIVLGVGLAKNGGVRRGVVRDIDETTRSVVAALRDAERMAGVRVTEVTCGIAGEHVAARSSSGVVAVTGDEIRPADVERANEVARAVSLGRDHELLHDIPQDYVVDQQRGISDPVGMTGMRLEVEMYLVTVQSTAAHMVSAFRCPRRGRARRRRPS